MPFDLVAVTAAVTLEGIDYPAEEHPVEFGDYYGAAIEVLEEWTIWMDKNFDRVLPFNNPKGYGWNLRPCDIAEMRLVYRR